jgi:hypothetical protein
MLEATCGGPAVVVPTGGVVIVVILSAGFGRGAPGPMRCQETWLKVWKTGIRATSDVKKVFSAVSSVV